jgi:ADP-ribose pyrophosphatase
VSDDAVEILGRETVHQGFFRLDRYRLRHRRYAGGWSAELSREVFERGRTVGILLYDPRRDEVVMVEQFRLPPLLAGFSGWQTEIVAGRVDRADETEIEVARREAQEEAGLAILGELERIHRYMPSPGACTERFDLYCGQVDARGAGGIFGLAAEHEDIKVVVHGYHEAMKLLRADRLQNGPTVLALYWLAAHRARLRRRWR